MSHQSPDDVPCRHGPVWAVVDRISGPVGAGTVPPVVGRPDRPSTTHQGWPGSWHRGRGWEVPCWFWLLACFAHLVHIVCLHCHKQQLHVVQLTLTFAGGPRELDLVKMYPLDAPPDTVLTAADKDPREGPSTLFQQTM